MNSNYIAPITFVGFFGSIVAATIYVKKYRSSDAVSKRNEFVEFERQAESYVTAAKYVAFKRAYDFYDEETYQEDAINDFRFVGIMAYNYPR